MNQEIIIKLNKTFEGSAFVQDGVEYWMARDLQVLLEYERWENFVKVVEKAKTSCATSKQVVGDHFLDATKMVKIGSETERKIDDIMLTRYACYLIAQNGDPRKETIAFAQSYFAIQTRKQEILEERIALTKSAYCRQFYEKTKKRLGAKAAIIALARRLVQITYSMLKDKRLYEERPFQVAFANL